MQLRCMKVSHLLGVVHGSEHIAKGPETCVHGHLTHIGNLGASPSAMLPSAFNLITGPEIMHIFRINSHSSYA